MKPQQPQRLTPPAPPGALLKRAFGIAQRIKLKVVSERDPVYLAMVRQMPCLKCGLEPCKEVAHIRFASAAFGKQSGARLTPPDRFAVPLCPACHTLDPDSQHRYKGGERQFWHDLGINPLLVAERLYAARGDPVRMRAVVLQAIAERDTIR
jgi:hypothetical protein